MAVHTCVQRRTYYIICFKKLSQQNNQENVKNYPTEKVFKNLQNSTQIFGQKNRPTVPKTRPVSARLENFFILYFLLCIGLLCTLLL